jgi:hypothetical protein
VITRDANARRLCAVCQSVQLTDERYIRFIAETFNHALLKIVPSNGRLRQYLGSFFCDPCLPRTSICSFANDEPSISNHWIDCPVKGGSIQLELVRNPGEGFSFSTGDAAQYGQLRNADARARKRGIVSPAKNA